MFWDNSPADAFSITPWTKLLPLKFLPAFGDRDFQFSTWCKIWFLVCKCVKNILFECLFDFFVQESTHIVWRGSCHFLMLRRTPWFPSTITPHQMTCDCFATKQRSHWISFWKQGRWISVEAVRPSMLEQQAVGEGVVCPRKTRGEQQQPDFS